jgi:hypothetical protein
MRQWQVQPADDNGDDEPRLCRWKMTRKLQESTTRISGAIEAWFNRHAGTFVMGISVTLVLGLIGVIWNMWGGNIGSMQKTIERIDQTTWETKSKVDQVSERGTYFNEGLSRMQGIITGHERDINSLQMGQSEMRMALEERYKRQIEAMEKEIAERKKHDRDQWNAIEQLEKEVFGRPLGQRSGSSPP